MKIEAGHYYERRDGEIGIAKATKVCSGCEFQVGDAYYAANTWRHKCHSNCDIVREVSVCPAPLPFTLRAGGKYETVKPDGTAGPVVTLNESSKRGWHKSYCDEFPFVVEGGFYIYSVTKNGTLLNYNIDALWAGYRIVAEHHEPTPLEKLEALCRRIIDGNDEKLNAELDACIAAVKGAK